MRIVKLFLITFCVFGLILPVIAEEKANDEEAMKKWTEYMTPGPNHKYMANQVGKWKLATTYWMAPGAPAQKSEGTAEGEMILGGRYLVLRHKGIMFGMPFEGIGITAYDNYKKKFISTWLDDKGTGIFISYGTLSKDGKVLTEVGDMDDIIENKTIKMKTVNTMINENKFKLEMYYIYPDGKKFKNMEGTYTRVK